MGVPTVKDLSPNVTLVLPLGIVNDIPSDDLKLTSLFFFREHEISNIMVADYHV